MSLSWILCQPNSAVSYCPLVDSDAVQFHAKATPLRSNVLCLSSVLKMEPECSTEQLAPSVTASRPGREQSLQS